MRVPEYTNADSRAIEFDMRVQEAKRIDTTREILGAVDPYMYLDKIPQYIPPNFNAQQNLVEANFMNLFEMRSAFKTGGKWDYKQNSGGAYEDFGNFHFGLIMAELNVPLEMAKAIGGAYQLASGTSPLEMNEKGKNDLNFFEKVWGWISDPNWGDDPRDQLQIENGWQLLNANSSECRNLSENNFQQLRLEIPREDSGIANQYPH
jgi:hypothetical protein